MWDLPLGLALCQKWMGCHQLPNCSRVYDANSTLFYNKYSFCFFFCFYSTVLRSLIIVASNISGFCWMMFWWGVILIHTNWYDILEASIWVVEWWRPSNEIVDENYLLFLLIFVIIIIFLFKVCMDFYQRKQKSLYGWVFGLLVRGGPVSGLERPKTKFCNFKAVY